MTASLLCRSHLLRTAVQGSTVPHWRSRTDCPPVGHTHRYASNKAHNSATKTHTYIWGTSNKPALPNLSKTLLRPTLVESPHPSGIKQIVFNTQHTVILCHDGSVHIYGDYLTEPAGAFMSMFQSSKAGDTMQQVDAVRNVHAVAAGVAHTVLLDNSGKVYTSGYGGSMLKSGALGHGDSKTRAEPTLVEALNDVVIEQISSGLYHNMALSNKHQLYAWGRGEYGRLGTGSSNDEKKPVLLEALQDYNITSIKCGSSFNIALTADGEVFTWGRNDKGQLGLGAGLILDTYSMESVPSQVEFDEDVTITNVDVGYRHCIVVDSENRVFRWGQAQHLQPTLVKGDDSRFLRNKIVQVAAGRNFSAAVDEHGHLFTFGDGGSCCLGHGNKTTVQQPALVEGFGPKSEFGRVVSVFASNTNIGVHTVTD